MSEERRRSRRLDLNVTIQLERLDEKDITTIKYVRADVFDMSKDGMGFNASQKLEVGTFYDTKIQIWTKEVMEIVIEIVRSRQLEDGRYSYGCRFIGMTETEALKIEIYQLFFEENEAQESKQ